MVPDWPTPHTNGSVPLLTSPLPHTILDDNREAPTANWVFAPSMVRIRWLRCWLALQFITHDAMQYEELPVYTTGPVHPSRRPVMAALLPSLWLFPRARCMPSSPLTQA